MCNEGAANHRYNWAHTDLLLRAVHALVQRIIVLVQRIIAKTTPATPAIASTSSKNISRIVSSTTTKSVARSLGACAKLGFYSPDLCRLGIFSLQTNSSTGEVEAGAQRIDMVRILLACGTLGHHIAAQPEELML